MIKISALITTYNEQDMLQDCLESVRWADELFVVDSFSTDRTLEIARAYNARISQHEYKYPAAQKNWAIPQASHEWILLLDADERVTPELQREIQQLLQSPPSIMLTLSIGARSSWGRNSSIPAINATT